MLLGQDLVNDSLLCPLVNWYAASKNGSHHAAVHPLICSAVGLHATQTIVLTRSSCAKLSLRAVAGILLRQPLSPLRERFP